jgi:hypothetical protein
MLVPVAAWAQTTDRGGATLSAGSGHATSGTPPDRLRGTRPAGTYGGGWLPGPERFYWSVLDWTHRFGMALP